MDVEKTKEGLRKAVEKLDKKIALLEKYKAKAIKQRESIVAKGWDPDDRYCRQGTPEHQDCYWAVCDYKETLNSIKRTESAIEDLNGTVSHWREKLDKALAEAKEHDELPEILITVENNIVTEWNRFDFERRANLKSEYAVMDHKDFIRRFTYSGYSFMRLTNDEIKKSNERSARALVLNLWKRVKDITGTVTDTSNLFITGANEYEGIALNGSVIGENGVANVESILAGGYNIQKLHIRTLVRKKK